MAVALQKHRCTKYPAFVRVRFVLHILPSLLLAHFVMIICVQILPVELWGYMMVYSAIEGLWETINIIIDSPNPSTLEYDL